MTMDSLHPYNPFENKKKNAPYTQEQVDYIKQLVDCGWSASKIAKEYNISSDSIRKRIKNNNWTAGTNKRSMRLTNDDLKDIKQMVDQKIDNSIICEKYQISEVTLLSRITNNKWTKTPRKNTYAFDYNYFDVIDSEHKAYWLGFLMADGYILSHRKGKRKNQSQSFGFAISMKDKELFDYFKEDLKTENPVNIYRNSTSSYSSNSVYGRILLTSQHTVDMLKTHGIVENKTFITKMPQLDDNLIPAFIRGYSDGDGSITIDKNNRLSWALCGTKELLNEIQNYFGFSYKLQQRFPERLNNNWTLKITGWKNVPYALSIVYDDATIYLKRKYNKYVEIQGIKNGVMATPAPLF